MLEAVLLELARFAHREIAGEVAIDDVFVSMYLRSIDASAPERSRQSARSDQCAAYCAERSASHLVHFGQ